MTILYFHGLGSDEQSRKFQLLKERFSTADVYCVVWNKDTDFIQLFEHWRYKTQEADNIILIGDSTGGNYAYQFRKMLTKLKLSSKLILINPLLKLENIIADFTFPKELTNTLLNIDKVENALLILSRRDEVIDHHASANVSQPFTEILWIEDTHRVLFFDKLLMRIESYIIDGNRKTATIFCGAKVGNSIEIQTAIQQLLSLFAEHRYDMVYGGSKKGIMGMAADIFKEHNSKVTGVVPYKRIKSEITSTILDKQIHVDNLYERKKLMIELADVCLVLPGGVGTMDELFDVLVNNRLRFTDKTIAIYNCLGYYDDIINQCNKMIKLGFLSTNFWDEIIIEQEATLLFDAVEALLKTKK